MEMKVEYYRAHLSVNILLSSSLADIREVAGSGFLTPIIF
jgi:hypothetical protein